MKFSTILIIGLMILLSIQIVNAEDSSTLYANKHYLIVGHIYEPYSDDNQVILTNIRTGEQLEVIVVDSEHGLKVYLFNLANLHRCWNDKDEIVITYNNNSTSIIIDDSLAGIQADLNAPEGYDPIPIIGGALVLSAYGSYYYIKRKSKIKGDEMNMNAEETEPIKAKPCIVDRIFGGTKKALLMLMLLTMITATLMDKPVPAEFINMATGLMLIYFGAGGVKLGMDIQNKK